MDPETLNFVVSLVSGLVGGNVGGALKKDTSMGPVWNSVLGALGGIGGSQLAGAVGDFGTVGTAGISVVIGALVPVVVGLFKGKSAS